MFESNFPTFTCVTSSSYSPWFSNMDKMLSSKAGTIPFFSIAPVSSYKTSVLMCNACIFCLLKLRLDFSIPLPLLLWLWEVEPAPENAGSGGSVWVFLFFSFLKKIKFACLPPQHWRRRAPRRAQLLLAEQKGSVFSVSVSMLASFWYKAWSIILKSDLCLKHVYKNCLCLFVFFVLIS